MLFQYILGELGIEALAYAQNSLFVSFCFATSNHHARRLVTYMHRFIYSLLDAVPPIHAESSHVATDKVPSM